MYTYVVTLLQEYLSFEGSHGTCSAFQRWDWAFLGANVLLIVTSERLGRKYHVIKGVGDFLFQLATFRSVMYTSW